MLEETDPQDSWHQKRSALGRECWKRLKLMWLHQKYNLNIICKNFSFLTFCIWITMLKLYKFWNRLTPDNWTGFCLKLKCALSTKIWGCNYIIGTLYNECLKMCKLDHITSKQTIYRTLWYNLHYNQLAFWGIIAKMRRSREFMEHSIVTEYSLYCSRLLFYCFIYITKSLDDFIHMPVSSNSRNALVCSLFELKQLKNTKKTTEIGLRLRASEVREILCTSCLEDVSIFVNEMTLIIIADCRSLREARLP